ncbi:transcription termination factor 3, mitochondrial-like [Antedon mediterranea]|uniref:transcription termination factor 3, mitochondrial-like n=1 Tax=Antedon mediterranea TaxID=105859 RepID=UPI003AF86718
MKMATTGASRCLQGLMRVISVKNVCYPRLIITNNHKNCQYMAANRTWFSTCQIKNNGISGNETYLIKDKIKEDTENVETSEIKKVDDGEDLNNNSLQHVMTIDKIQPFDDNTYVDILAETETPTILDSYTKPSLPAQTFTLQSFVQQSPTLQKLVHLGVDLHKIQKRQDAANAILKMDFDRDIKDKIAFLYNVGVASDNLGNFITKNPHILSDELNSLEVRISYLNSKKFSKDSISLIVNRAPYFLSFSTERVDRKLGYFQKEFHLTGNEVRHLVTKCPQLVTNKISRIQENMYVIHNLLGFSKSAMKVMVLKSPKLLLAGKQSLMNTFDYIHNEMEIPHQLFIHFPAVLRTRLLNVKERDQYLRNLGLAQYDPKMPGYISLQKLVEGSDELFCQEIAKSSVEDFNAFLKTI